MSVSLEEPATEAPLVAETEDLLDLGSRPRDLELEGGVLLGHPAPEDVHRQLRIPAYFFKGSLRQAPVGEPRPHQDGVAIVGSHGTSLHPFWSMEQPACQRSLPGESGNASRPTESE